MTPGARRSEIVGVADGRLRVRVAAPASEGRANRELCRLLGETLGVPTRAVEIVAGAGSRRKQARVVGVEPKAARRALGLPGSPEGSS